METRNDGALLNAFQAIINNDTTGLGDANRDKFVGNSINLAYSSLSRMELQALYRSSAICQKVVDLLPKAATSENWLEVLLDEGKQGVSGKVFQYAEDLKFRSAIREAAIMGRLDGDGFVVIGADDGRSPDQPVNEAAIRQISWVVPLNRYQLFPDANSGRPGHPEYYQLYLQRTEALESSSGQPITTGKIHRSRVLRIPGKQLYSDLIYVNSGYNDSILQAFYQSFSKYLVALEYSARMVQDYNLFIYKLKGLANLILQGKEADILKRFRAINMSMSSLGGLAMDNENEDGQFISRNYAGLDQIIDRLKDDTGAASGMPPSKLWGTAQKSALSSGAEGDKYEWADCVTDYRSEMLHEPVLDFFRLVFLAKNSPTSGKLPESWSVKYASALRLTLKEQIELRKAQTQGVDVPSIAAKILLPEEVRQSAWSGAEYSVERSLQPDLYAKQQKAQEQQPNDATAEPGQPEAAEPKAESEAELISPDDFLKNSQAEFGRKDAADLPITPEQFLDLKAITEEANPDGVDAIRDVAIDDKGRLTWIFRDESQLLRATLEGEALLTDYLGEVGQTKTDAADRGVLRLIERADKHLRSLEDSAIDRINTALESSYKDLEAKLLALYSQDSGGSVMAKHRALVLLSQVSDLLTLLNTRNADAIQQQFEDLLRGAGNAGVSLAQELVQAIANETLKTFAQVPVAAVRFAAQNAVRRLKNHGEEFREKVSTLVIQGLIQGWGTDAIAREMRRELSVTQSKAVMIARTEVLAANNDAAQAAYAANGIEAFQLIATLDDRTCPYCAARNMRVYKLGESQPPLHPHCRCYSLPWKQEWQRLGLTNDAWASQYRQKALTDLKTQGLEPKDGASPFEKANGQESATPLWTPSLLTLDELRFDKWSKRGKGKPRNCKTGRSCGGGCISMGKQCRKELSPGGKKKGGAIAKAVGAKAGKGKAAGGGGGGASAPSPDATSVKAEIAAGGHDDIPKIVKLSLVGQKQPDGTFKFLATTSSSGGERKETEISQKAFKANVDKYFDGNIKAAKRGKAFGAEKQIEAMAKNAGITPEQAQAAKDSIIEFTGVSYKEIRSVQRGLKTGLTKEQADSASDHIKNINRYIENAPPFKGEVYRGMNFTSTKERNAFLRSIDGGFSLEAISSSSSDRGVARLFATGEGTLKDNPPSGHGVLFKINNRSGVSIQNISDYPEEREVLIPKGAKYSVRSVNRKGKIIEVELDEPGT